MNKERIELELDSVNNTFGSIQVFQGEELVSTPDYPGLSAYQVLSALAEDYPGATLCWFDSQLKNQLIPCAVWPGLLNHDLEIRFYPESISPESISPELASLGLIFWSTPYLFPDAQQEVMPSWLISSLAGVCRISLFAGIQAPSKVQKFSISLMAFSKAAMYFGLCPYADRRLLETSYHSDDNKFINTLSWSDIAIYIAQTSYQSLLVWLIGMVFLQRRLPLVATIRGLLARQRVVLKSSALVKLKPPLSSPAADIKVDVIIPTLERPQYLLQILKDLAAQDYPLYSVHVVAQGAESVAEDIDNIDWPFALHIHQVSWVGVCRARNYGIQQGSAEWVLLVDDDVRLPTNYVSHLLSVALSFHVDVVNAVPEGAWVNRGGNNQSEGQAVWNHFLSGFALCSRRILMNTGFNEQMEGIVYEDWELGVRLRCAGSQVIADWGLEIINEAAPEGGFRSANIAKPNKLAGKVRPILAVYYSLSSRLTLAMKIGFKIDLLISILRNTRCWQWPRECYQLMVDWRIAKQWFCLLPTSKRSRF